MTPVPETASAASPNSESRRWFWWTVGAVVMLTALGVFAVPWLVRQPTLRIASDSQALGFNNRIAIVSLGLGCLAMLGLGRVWRARYAAHPDELVPCVLLDPVPLEERVSRRLVVILSAIAVCLLALVAFMMRGYPYADNAYFVDRLLQAVNGGRFNADFEFSYGPAFLYPQYLLSLATRQLGISVFMAYYVAVACAEVLGLFMAAFLVNRLRTTRRMRRLLFAIVAAVAIVGVPSLGPNYSLIRFSLPFVLLILTLSRTRRGGLVAVVLPVGAVLGAHLVSPEIGVVTSCALATSLAVSATPARASRWTGAVLAFLAGVGGLYAYGLTRGSALAGFASGNANFPIYPGHPAVVFVLMMLATCAFASMTMTRGARDDAAAQVGWLAACLIFMAPALGRSDWIHVFWNGFGAILLLTALLSVAAPRLAYGFSITIAVLYVISASTFFLTAITPQLFASGVNTGVITPYMARGYAHRIGRKYSDGSNWWVKARKREPSATDVAWLAKEGGVLSPEWLSGSWAETLAEAHALQPLYEPPLYIGTEYQLSASLADLRAARHVVVSRGQYKKYKSLLRTADKNHWGVFHTSKSPISGSSGAPQFFPLNIRPAYPVLDPQLAFARKLRSDWEIDRTSGDYYILRPRE